MKRREHYELTTEEKTELRHATPLNAQIRHKKTRLEKCDA